MTHPHFQSTLVADDFPQILIEDGPYKGHQAIVIQPAKPFRFLDLKPEIRNRIYKQYFAMKGIINEDIVFDGKRNISKEAYAKSYAQGSKDRVALLAVCKEVRHPEISCACTTTD